MNVFVQNRTSQILQFTAASQWGYVPSKQNPADLLTRGVTLKILIDKLLWWNGPFWLVLPPAQWPSQPLRSSQTFSTTVISNCQNRTPFQVELLTKFSSFRKLIRVIAYCKRIFLVRSSSVKIGGPISLSEWNSALQWVYECVQNQAFAKEIVALSNNECVPKNSPLSNLSPFLDQNGLIRVGGRLKFADLNFSQKHPILLPTKHYVTRLYIEYHHQRNFHANPQMLISIIRQEVWIPNIRSAIRSVIAKCVTCFRIKPRLASQIMADLPKERVQLNLPFSITGVDCCGPFFIKSGFRKNAQVVKSYVVIFVCFTTRAVHLEVLENLSTDAFLLALERFVSRRGCPTIMWSDNATNFRGAAAKLKDYFRLVRSAAFQSKITDYAVDNNIQWKWITPLAPHQGGIWEAAVKQFKVCFRTIAGTQSFTYPQLYTTTCQIEACLNSRPLFPLSDDPSDLSAVTPAHFLIGRSLKAIPSPSVLNQNPLSLRHWERVIQLHQRFWKIWSCHYLNSLQIKSKWNTSEPNVNVGDLVLVKENNLPPLLWKLARVSKTYPDVNGKVRTVEIKTKQGTFLRTIRKLAPLPVSEVSSETEGRDVQTSV